MWTVLLLVMLSHPRAFAKCPSKSPKNLTAPFGTIMTPNFPGKFETPYCAKWVIDSGPVDPNNPQKYIHVYYTQPYFKKMTPPDFIIEFHEYYPFEIFQRLTRQGNWVKGRRRRVKRSSVEDKLKEAHPHNLRGPLAVESTHTRYMSIEVKIDSLYNTQFRARDAFLHVYGFNLTYEISNSSRPQKDRCGIYSCRAAGNCYAAKDYKSFFCGCQEGRHGMHCEYGSICDPEKNINPCQNGGLCQTMGSGSVSCTCKPGFVGLDCSRSNFTFVKVCPGPDCPLNCDQQASIPTRPCSCFNGRTKKPIGWIRYDAECPTNSRQKLQYSWSWKSGGGNLPEENLKIKDAIELRLTQRLRDLIPTLEKMDNFSVTVVAIGFTSIQFQFYGPSGMFNEADSALSVLAQEVVYPGIQFLLPFKLRSIPALLLEDVSMKPGGTIREHDNYSITCSAVGSSNITFKWFKDDIPIEPTMALSGRITEMLWRQEGAFRSTSTLNFDKAHVNDRGTFTCQVSDADEEQCKDFQMDILARPIINVENMSLTLIKNTPDTVITCNATLDDSVERNWSYDWKIDGELIGPQHTNEVKEELFPRGSLLRIINAEQSKTYTCIVTNTAGEDTFDVRVEVLDSSNSPSCPAQMDNSISKLKWGLAAPNQTSKRLCPVGCVGFARRTCKFMVGHLNPEWEDPDFSKCVNRTLKAIDKSVQNAKLGFTYGNQLSELTISLSAYMKAKGFLYLGEGERIIQILNNLGLFAIEKGNPTDATFFELFLNTTTTFLTFPESCFNERSVISLCNLIHKMAAHYSSSNEFSFHSKSLIIEGPKMISNSSLLYPSAVDSSRSPPWLADFHLEIPNDAGHEATFTLVILRNLTFSVTPRERRDTKNPFQLISPVAFIDSGNYQFSHNKRIVLRFKISPEWTRMVLKRRANITCESLDTNPLERMSWKSSPCSTASCSNGIVECSCDRFGQYGVLGNILEDEESYQHFTLHWSVLFGSIVCISSCSLALVCILGYTHCQVLTNSIYLLKLVVCFSLIISVLFSLSLRAATTSIPLTSALCTFLVLSLSSHLAASLKIFLATYRRDMEWLRSVPLFKLLLAITFASVLPLWTCAAAMLSSSWEDSALDEASPLFGTFMTTLVIILVLFIAIYYKATLQLRKDRSRVDSGKIHVINYRMKTLNRAFAITISTMVMALSAILHNNAFNPVYQYFFGFSTFKLGLLVLLSYTVKSEYPIPSFLTRHLSIQPEFPDPEKPHRMQNCRSPLKKSSGQRQISSILLRDRRSSRNSSEPETTLETFLGGSSICSKARASSFASSKYGQSRTPQPNPLNTTNPFFTDQSRPFIQRPEWNTLSLASSARPIRTQIRPQRGKCLLTDTATCVRLPLASHSMVPTTSPIISETDTDDYVEPTVRPKQIGCTSNQILQRRKVELERLKIGEGTSAAGPSRNCLDHWREVGAAENSPVQGIPSDPSQFEDDFPGTSEMDSSCFLDTSCSKTEGCVGGDASA